MKIALYSGVACLALSAFALGNEKDRADSPNTVGDIQVEVVSAWVELFSGQGINDQVLDVAPARTEVPFRATLNVDGHGSGYAGLLIASEMAAPHTFVVLDGQVSQLFINPASIQLVLFESFDFSPGSAGIVNFQGPPIPTAFLGWEWYAQAYVTSPSGTELSTMAGGVVGNCP